MFVARLEVFRQVNVVNFCTCLSFLCSENYSIPPPTTMCVMLPFDCTGRLNSVAVYCKSIVIVSVCIL